MDNSVKKGSDTNRTYLFKNGTFYNGLTGFNRYVGGSGGTMTITTNGIVLRGGGSNSVMTIESKEDFNSLLGDNQYVYVEYESNYSLTSGQYMNGNIIGFYTQTTVYSKTPYGFNWAITSDPSSDAHPVTKGLMKFTMSDFDFIAAKYMRVKVAGEKVPTTQGVTIKAIWVEK